MCVTASRPPASPACGSVAWRAPRRRTSHLQNSVHRAKLKFYTMRWHVPSPPSRAPSKCHSAFRCCDFDCFTCLIKPTSHGEVLFVLIPLSVTSSRSPRAVGRVRTLFPVKANASLPVTLGCGASMAVGSLREPGAVGPQPGQAQLQELSPSTLRPGGPWPVPQLRAAAPQSCTPARSLPRWPPAPGRLLGPMEGFSFPTRAVGW